LQNSLKVIHLHIQDASVVRLALDSPVRVIHTNYTLRSEEVGNALIWREVERLPYVSHISR
jgi:hypothetical protein